MKIPKTVFIAGKEWKIVIDKKEAGASFCTSETTMTIGTLWGEGQTRENFLHEILEAILCERMLRYKLRDGLDNGDLMFVMKHEDMSQVVQDLALALKDVIK